MKVAFVELQDFRPEPVDWGRIIRDLSKAGIAGELLADTLGRSPSSVDKWKNHGKAPRYEVGAALLAMHARFCGDA